jgi:Zn finger protein HypA/HybF involved in hydrogenase expression
MVKRLDFREVKEFIEKDGKYSLLSRRYGGCMEKLEIMCNTCNKPFLKTFNKFKSAKQGCSHCSKQQHTLNKYSSEEDVFKKLQKVHDNTLIFLSSYKGDHEKIKIKSTLCNHTWEATPHNLKKGNYCPKCKESKLEMKTSKVLDLIRRKLPHWSYEREKRFNDCKDKYTLPFDFYLHNKKTNKFYLIECQGIQHYESTFFSKNFDDRVRKDRIKSNYAMENRIPLLSIKYNQEDLRATIFEFLGIRAHHRSNSMGESSLIAGKSDSQRTISSED